MNTFVFQRMNNEVNRKFKMELRDKLIDNMNLDDVDNIEVIADYLNNCNITQLLEINEIAKVFDWQYIGRIIGTIAETYKNKEGE